MRLTTRPSEIVMMVVALLLPFKAGGCAGRTACITVSASDLQSNGTCPDSMTASGRLVDVCGGSIASVDGSGTLDGDLCCYPVTYNNNNGATPPCEFDPGVGGGSSMGFSSSSGSFGGGGTIITTGTGTPGCVTCNEALNGAPFDQVCNGGVDGGPSDPSALLSNLRVCACASACTTACDPTLCLGNAPDNACLTCLEGACASDLMTCRQN